SSRRRHTRLVSDWSSDVCSSDLVQAELLAGSLWARAKRFVLGEETHPRAAVMLVGTPGRYAAIVLSGRGDPVSFEWALGERRGRSEERRVGKGWRWGGGGEAERR